MSESLSDGRDESEQSGDKDGSSPSGQFLREWITQEGTDGASSEIDYGIGGRELPDISATCLPGAMLLEIQTKGPGPCRVCADDGTLGLSIPGLSIARPDHNSYDNGSHAA